MVDGAIGEAVAAAAAMAALVRARVLIWRRLREKGKSLSWLRKENHTVAR